MRVCRKEAKETHFWLRLLKDTSSSESEDGFTELIQESFELLKIFSSIIEKIK
jgi:four helix bundle protein